MVTVKACFTDIITQYKQKVKQMFVFLSKKHTGNFCRLKAGKILENKVLTGENEKLIAYKANMLYNCSAIRYAFLYERMVLTGDGRLKCR